MARRPVRIEGQPSDEWSETTRVEMEGIVATARGRPSHLPSVIAHHPTYLGPYLEWAKAVALRGVLQPRSVAILALRVAANWKSDFEWGVHAERAADASVLSPAEISAVATGRDAAVWSALDRSLISAADELCANGDMGEGTWALLAEEHNAAELVEICLVVGHYTMLSMLANATGVLPESRWAPFGQAPMGA
jgi:4-carboxymuconolactone decarboxylase